jgi:general stress protein 26
MTKDFLYNFMRTHKYGVLATVNSDNVPEAAYVGIAVTADLHIIFDTVSDSRKFKNLFQNPNIALVIGWDNEQTIQYEGIASIPSTNELEKLLPVYFSNFPDGIDRKGNWKNIVYISVKPKWLRYSDFNESTYQVEEFTF